MNKILLSPPVQSPKDLQRLTEAFDSGWLAPLGPEVDAFQLEFANRVGSRYAVALSSGTAALHLALIAAEIGTGDEVWCSSLTFAASANPIRYVGAIPTFVDSERDSWNIDPDVVEEALRSRVRTRSPLPKALIAVHLYGQAADIDRLKACCEHYGVTLIEDAAEALGSSYKGRHPGNDSFAGIFSFNGNKIITTTGGGMLVTPHESVAKLALKLATQAREPAAHYQHELIGYNYRLSNLLAALGRSQLATLDERVAARRRIFNRYVETLGNLPGITFQPEAPWGIHTRWLTCCLIDAEIFGVDREVVRLKLEAAGVESRPLWKPMHLQPVFKECEFIGDGVSGELFERGLCLPSGSGMTDDEQNRVISVIEQLVR